MAYLASAATGMASSWRRRRGEQRKAAAYNEKPIAFATLKAPCISGRRNEIIRRNQKLMAAIGG
jgi:hypothetical protein